VLVADADSTQKSVISWLRLCYSLKQYSVEGAQAIAHSDQLLRRVSVQSQSPKSKNERVLSNVILVMDTDSAGVEAAAETQPLKTLTSEADPQDDTRLPVRSLSHTNSLPGSQHISPTASDEASQVGVYFKLFKVKIQPLLTGLLTGLADNSHFQERLQASELPNQKAKYQQ
jgi:hypothetical protein